MAVEAGDASSRHLRLELAAVRRRTCTAYGWALLVDGGEHLPVATGCAPVRRGVTHTEAVLLAALHGALVASQCSATSLVIATDSSIAVRQLRATDIPATLPSLSLSLRTLLLDGLPFPVQVSPAVPRKCIGRALAQADFAVELAGLLSAAGCTPPSRYGLLAGRLANLLQLPVPQRAALEAADDFQCAVATAVANHCNVDVSAALALMQPVKATAGTTDKLPSAGHDGCDADSSSSSSSSTNSSAELPAGAMPPEDVLRMYTTLRMGGLLGLQEHVTQPCSGTDSDAHAGQGTAAAADQDGLQTRLIGTATGGEPLHMALNPLTSEQQLQQVQHDGAPVQDSTASCSVAGHEQSLTARQSPPGVLSSPAWMMMMMHRPGAAGPHHAGVGIGGGLGSERYSLPAVASECATHLLQFDGASRGNPGRGSYGFVLFDLASGVLLQRGCMSLPYGVNAGQAELEGLVAGLEAAVQAGVRHLAVQGDSTLVIDAIVTRRSIGSGRMVQAHQRAMGLLREFDAVDFQAVPRERNTLADRLASISLAVDTALYALLRTGDTGLTGMLMLTKAARLQRREAVLEQLLSRYSFPLLVAVLVQRVTGITPPTLLARLEAKAAALGDPNPWLVQQVRQLAATGIPQDVLAAVGDILMDARSARTGADGSLRHRGGGRHRAAAGGDRGNTQNMSPQATAEGSGDVPAAARRRRLRGMVAGSGTLAAAAGRRSCSSMAAGGCSSGRQCGTDDVQGVTWQASAATVARLPGGGNDTVVPRLPPLMAITLSGCARRVYCWPARLAHAGVGSSSSSTWSAGLLRAPSLPAVIPQAALADVIGAASAEVALQRAAVRGMLLAVTTALRCVR